jgi:plastocyanin
MRQRRTWPTVMLALVIGPAWVARAGLIPGGGPQRSDCYVELDVEGAVNPGAQVAHNRLLRCLDGDTCDADAACGNDACTFRVAVCIGQHDPNLPACTPASALRRLGVKPQLESARPPTMDGSACGSSVDLTVPLRVRRNGRKLPGKLVLPMNATAERGTSPARDRDRIVLQCLPNPSCAGAAPTTSTTTTTVPEAQVRTVTVGPGGALRFDPSSITIHVGETVRWSWSSGGHNVVSGSGGTADGRFCSPDDRGCGSAPLSGAGATYEHTFMEAGTFPYFCSPHVTFGMTGRVVVEP